MLQEGSFRTILGQRDYEVSRNLMNDIVVSNERGRLAFLVAEHDVTRFAEFSSQELIDIYDQGYGNGLEAGKDTVKKTISKTLRTL